METNKTQTAAETRRAKYPVGSQWMIGGTRCLVHAHMKTGVCVSYQRLGGSPALRTVPWARLDRTLTPA